MIALTDAAAFNRQGTLKLGEAVKGATDGFKNMLCLKYDSLIYDPIRDETKTIEEWHDSGDIPCVFSMDRSTGKVKAIQASYIHYNGERQVFEIEFEDSKKIEATANHRFLTQRGFRFLDELTEEDYIYIKH